MKQGTSTANTAMKITKSVTSAPRVTKAGRASTKTKPATDPKPTNEAAAPAAMSQADAKKQAEGQAIQRRIDHVFADEKTKAAAVRAAERDVLRVKNTYQGTENPLQDKTIGELICISYSCYANDNLLAVAVEKAADALNTYACALDTDASVISIVVRNMMEIEQRLRAAVELNRRITIANAAAKEVR